MDLFDTGLVNLIPVLVLHLLRNLSGWRVDGDHGEFGGVEEGPGVCFVTDRNPGPQGSSHPKWRAKLMGSLDLSHGTNLRLP